MPLISLYKQQHLLPLAISNKLKLLPPQVKGIGLALISCALMVVVGVLVRKLSSNIDIFQILFFRQSVFIVLLLPAVVLNIKRLLRPQHVKLHSLRIIGAFFGLYFSFLTISHIPFTDATALGFSKVLFVALISRLFLAEKVGPARLFTIVIGFLGVLLVVQPSFNDNEFIYILSGLLGAAGASVAIVCIRKLSQTESRLILMTYQAVFVGLIAFIPSLLHWHSPSSSELVLLLLVGVLSAAAQWIGISAYKCAEANIVANVDYVKIIYSTLLGYYLFFEIPNNLALFGAVVILASALIPIFMMRKKDHENKPLKRKNS